jgi:hypothetical protein
MPYLYENDIKKELDKILEAMEDDLGIKLNRKEVDEANKLDGVVLNQDDIINLIANKLSYLDGKENLALNDHDIRNENVQKKLIACITSLIMGKKEDFESLIKNLRSEKKQDQDIGIDPKLQAELKILISLTKILNPDPNVTNTKTLTLSELKEAILKDIKQKMKDPPDEKELLEFNLIEKQVDATLRNLNGGDNPRINGEINFTILGPIIGNLFGFTNQTYADPMALTKMQKDITYNPGDPDHVGLEAIARTDLIADGIIEGLNLGRGPQPIFVK